MSLRLLFSLVMAGLCLLGSVSCSPATPAASYAESGDAAQRYVPLLKDPDALVRKRAAVALKRMGAKAKSAVPALEEALTDQDAEVRAAVAAALETIDPIPRPAEEKPTSPPPAKPKTPDEPGKNSSPQSSKPREVGSYFFGPRSPLSILMRRGNEGDAWRRLKGNERLSTGDRLVSLPGYASELRLDSGVRLLLRGHLREFSLFSDMDYLQESAVVLHKNKDVDADLTLQTGRLYLSNHKKDGPAVVRLRFEKKAWEVTLQEPGAEVVVDLLKRYSANVDYRKGEAPVTTLHLFVLKGKAGLAAEHQHYPELSAPPDKAYFVWDNKRGGLRGPFQQAQVPSFFTVELPREKKNQQIAEKMDRALKALSQRMLPPKDPTVVLAEVLQKSNDPMQHALAIYCLGALDDAAALLNVLADPDPARAPDRDTAVFALRRWLGRGEAQGRALYDDDKHAGLLIDDRRYSAVEARTLYQLLHDFSEDEILSVETYEYLARDLVSNKVAIAELARWHLYRLARLQGVSLPSLDKFNAAFPRDVRAAVSQEVHAKIEKGELPVRGPLDKSKGK